MFYGPETLNKEGYLSRVDSLKSIECQSTILKIQVLDSIVKTEERELSIIDSLLEVNPAIIRKKTYRFIDDKLQSITVDSTLYLEEYFKSLHEKVIPFTFYVNDQYDIEDDKEIFANIKKYLSEYVSLPASDKKEYRHYAHLQGTYVSKDCAFYRKLIFRGKKTVTIVDAIFGMSPFKIRDLLLTHLPKNDINIKQKSTSNNYFVFLCLKGTVKMIVELLQIKGTNFILVHMKYYSGNQDEFAIIKKQIHLFCFALNFS